MPILSAFTPCGALACSSDPSHIEEFYDQLPALWGSQIDFSEVGSYDEAKLYATARLLAIVRYGVDMVHNESLPERSFDLLPLHELDYLMTPGPRDNIPTRQAALAAVKALPRGGTVANIVNAMRALIGVSFLAYVPNPAGSSAVTVPAAPGSGPGAFRDVRIAPRVVQLVDPVVQVGVSSWCSYQNLDPTNPSATKLHQNDVVVLDGGNTNRMEKVTVLAVADSPPAFSNATPGYPCFRASFAKAHEAGAAVSTGNHPYWWSTRRTTLFVCSAAVPVDRPTCARIDSLLAKLCKGVEQWSIVSPTSTSGSGGTIGPLTVGAGMGTTTIGAISYTNSM